jgi:release factor glutamine methyltransferase
MSEPRTVPELLEVGERVLTDSSHIFEDHDHPHEARALLATALGVTIEEVERKKLGPPTPRARDKYLALVARRAAGEPLPILTGRIEFYGLDLKVKAGAFVPRPSSELLVDRAAKKLKKRRGNPIVLDACTGAGPIAIALADEFPHAEVWGTDIAEEGLRHGRANARALGITNLTLKRGDMYGGLPARLRGSVDVITSHVPYVPVGEVDDLPSEVKEHEPIYTLTDSSSDGLGLMRQAIREAPEWLKPGGWLLLEMSEDITTKVRKLCEKAGLEDHGVASDNDGLSVVVEASLPK